MRYDYRRNKEAERYGQSLLDLSAIENGLTKMYMEELDYPILPSVPYQNDGAV